MKSTAKNTFIAKVDVDFPDGEQGSSALRWLNLQHTGKELIPLDEKIGESHRNAGYKIHRGRQFRMKFEIDKTGEWKFIKVL